MIKLFIKLAIVALLANAAYHIGSEYLTYIKFRDAVRDAAMFKAKTDAELLGRTLDLAGEYELPLDAENVTIEREQRKVLVDGWYDKPVEVLPNYFYPWHFGFTVETMIPASIAP